MNSSNYIQVRYRKAIFVIVIALLCLPAAALCQNANVAIMIQQSPPDGGTVTPGIGVHNLATNSELALSAVPKPGYQFVCWLGDVSDASASRTATYVNSPKIIIAVFERTQYDFLAGMELSLSAPGQRLQPGAADYSRGGISPIAAKRPHKYRYPDYTPEEPEDFPVPDDDDNGDDFPVPEVPEPATAALLALGSIFLSRRRSGRLKRK